MALVLGAMTQTATAQQRDYQRVYNETDGRRIYIERCAECHMPDGRGRGDGENGFPPLTGMSEWFALREGQMYVAHAIIFGPYGSVMVDDTFYYGMMPRFGPRFDNQQIVAVVRYIAEELNQPLPGYVPITQEMVAEARRLPDNMGALTKARDMLPWR